MAASLAETCCEPIGSRSPQARFATAKKDRLVHHIIIYIYIYIYILFTWSDWISSSHPTLGNTTTKIQHTHLAESQSHHVDKKTFVHVCLILGYNYNSMHKSTLIVDYAHVKIFRTQENSFLQCVYVCEHVCMCVCHRGWWPQVLELSAQTIRLF